jgi:hypothetical protein
MDQNVEEEKEANQTYQEDLGSRQDNTQKFGQTGERLKKKREEENQAYETDLNTREENAQNFVQVFQELRELQEEQDLEKRWSVIEQQIERIDFEDKSTISKEVAVAFQKQIEDLIQDYQSSNLEDKEAIIETLEEAYGFFDQILEDCSSEEESDSSDELEMSSDSDISSGAGSPPSSPIASPILSRSSTFKQEIAQQSQTLTIEQTTSLFTNPSVYKITPLEIPQPKTTQTLTSSLDQISNPTLVLDIPSPQVIDQIRNNLEETIEYQASASDTQTAIIEPKVVVVESSNSVKENTTLSSVKKASLENSQEKTVQKTTQVFAKKANVQEEIDLNLELLFPSIPSLTPLQTAEKETEKAELELKKIEEVRLREQSTAKSLVQIAKDLLAETAWMNLVFDQSLEDQLKFSIDQANLLLSSLELISEEKEIKNLNHNIEGLKISISNLKEEIAKFNSEIAILEQAKVEKLTPETKLSIADPSMEAKILAKSTKDSKAAVNDLKSQIVELTSKLNTDTTRLTANLNAKMRLLKNLTHNIEAKITQLILEKERLQAVITKIEADHLEAFKDLSKEQVKYPVVALNALRKLAKSNPHIAKQLIQSLKNKDPLYKNHYITEINRLEPSKFPPELIQNLREAFLVQESTRISSTFDPLIYSPTLQQILSYLPSVEQVRIAQVCRNWKEEEIKDYDYKANEVKQCYLLIKEFRTLIPNLNIDSNIKNSLWSQYYRLLANLNLKKAIKEVSQIKESFWTFADKYRDPALFEIVKVAVLTNLDEAKKIANTIKDPYQRTKAYLEIAKVDPSHNIQATEQAFNEIKYYEDQDQAFVKIIKFKVLKDIKSAIETANNTKSKYHKALALAEIVKADPLHDLTEAKKAAHNIQDAQEKALVLAKIAKADPLHDWNATVHAIDDIEIEEEDHDEKLDMFFLKIMRMASLSNLSIAKKIAEKIKYSNYDFKAFLVILKVNALDNITATTEKVNNIQSEYHKALALAEIAKADPLHDLTEAKKSASKITDLNKKALAFIEIAEVLF